MESNKKKNLSLIKEELSVSDMVEIQAGINVAAACGGFAAVAGVYELGVLANFWNPIGWGGQAALAVGGVGCGIYALFS